MLKIIPRICRRAAQILTAVTILTNVIPLTTPCDANAASIILASAQDTGSEYSAVSYDDNYNYFIHIDEDYLSLGYYGTGYTALAFFTKTMPTDLASFQDATLSFNFQVFEGNSAYTNFNFSLNGADGTSTSINTNLVSLFGGTIDTSFHTLTFQLVDGAFSTTGAILDGASIAPSALNSSTSTGFSLADFNSWTLRVGDNWVTTIGVNIDTIELLSIPEPTSIALILSGGAMLFYIIRKRRRLNLLNNAQPLA